MIKGLAIDMDGTVYKGMDVIPGAREFISELKRRGIPFTFVTNNSSRGRNQVVLIGNFQCVNHQLDVCVVLLADPVTQAGHNRKSVAQQHFLQIVKLIRISVYFAQQDIPANLDLLQDALQRGNLGPAVFQINK